MQPVVRVSVSGEELLAVQTPEPLSRGRVDGLMVVIAMARWRNGNDVGVGKRKQSVVKKLPVKRK